MCQGEVVDGVAPNDHAGAVHGDDLGSGHERRPAEEAGDDVVDGDETVSLEDRLGHRREVVVAVVEAKPRNADQQGS
jgi:hypothetical protein